MKRLAILLSLLCLPVMLYASGISVPLLKVKTDIGDINSLQRGAKYFVNYCMGCHSLKYSSYGRIAKDLELEEDQVQKDLIVSWEREKRLGSYMTTAMTKKQSEAMLGKAPPDLSLIVKSKSTRWLYTFLKSFYSDPSGDYGVGNALYPTGMGMPHVLVGLQGLQEAVFIEKCVGGELVVNAKTKKKECKGGNMASRFSHFKKKTIGPKGSMTASQYDLMVRDLVTFLEYVSEPAKLERQRIGIWVMLFMILFTALAYLLKKEYWRDVH